MSYLQVRGHYAGVDGNLVPRMCRRLIRVETGPSERPWRYGLLPASYP